MMMMLISRAIFASQPVAQSVYVANRGEVMRDEVN